MRAAARSGARALAGMREGRGRRKRTGGRSDGESGARWKFGMVMDDGEKLAYEKIYDNFTFFSEIDLIKNNFCFCHYKSPVPVSHPCPQIQSNPMDRIFADIHCQQPNTRGLGCDTPAPASSRLNSFVGSILQNISLAISPII